MPLPTPSDYSNDFHFGFLDSLNPSHDRGDAEFDIRQRFVASAIWQSPFLVGSTHRWERLVLDGWSLAPIFTASTGKPFSVWDCSNAVGICPRYIPSAPVSIAGHAVDIGEPNFFRTSRSHPPFPMPILLSGSPTSAIVRS